MSLIQRFVYHQLHTFKHAADTQRYIALSTLDFKGEMGGDPEGIPRTTAATQYLRHKKNA
ncbi:hypothetical protein RMQ99_18110 [Pseudomonas canadensis]|nr:hypothetical protein [Pseudomonas canadensis]WNJ87872.1 hypothetical protein RMQ99_18110 [Pseudomonas canadensis]